MSTTSPVSLPRSDVPRTLTWLRRWVNRSVKRDQDKVTSWSLRRLLDRLDREQGGKILVRNTRNGCPWMVNVPALLNAYPNFGMPIAKVDDIDEVKDAQADHGMALRRLTDEVKKLRQRVALLEGDAQGVRAA